jgi:hypothetical protein
MRCLKDRGLTFRELVAVNVRRRERSNALAFVAAAGTVQPTGDTSSCQVSGDGSRSALSVGEVSARRKALPNSVRYERHILAWSRGMLSTRCPIECVKQVGLMHAVS